MITQTHVALLAVVLLVFVLYTKGYLDTLLGSVKPTPKAKPTSDKLFEAAIVVALDEYKDKQTQKLVDHLKTQVELVVANPFAPAGATPPAQPAPASTPSVGP